MLRLRVYLLSLHFLFLLMIKLDMLAGKQAQGYRLLAEGLLPMDPDKTLTPTEAVNPLFLSHLIEAANSSY